MVDRRRVKAVCPATGKIRYAGQTEATNVALVVTKKNERDGEKNPRVDPYPCERCLGWHVGHARRTVPIPREGEPAASAARGEVRTGPTVRAESNMARKQKQEVEEHEDDAAQETTGRAVARPNDDGGELAHLAPNYFEEYGRQAASRPIVGKLLKFSKGEYLAGQENEEVDEGTEVVACVDTLQVGWVKWVDSMPVEQQLGLIADGYKPLKRAGLGDLDEDEWEVDEQSGKPRDPWQFANQVTLRPVDWDGSDDTQFTFVTQSKGGVSAVGELCKYYGKEVRQREGEYPVVALNMRSYLHSNKQFGKIWVPVFEPTGEWVGVEPVTKRKPEPAKSAKPVKGDTKSGKAREPEPRPRSRRAA